MATNSSTLPKCIYNHELLILFTSQTPYQSYRDPVSEAQITGYVDELKGTQVDALMCCPTAWRCVLWPSDVDPRWKGEDLERRPPAGPYDIKYHEKAYWRAHQYMSTGADPVKITRDRSRENGLPFFFSYRMNDHHHLWDLTCPTHDKLWLDHPEFRVSPGKPSKYDYTHTEVRKHYLDLLTELTERYDPEGLELDFMRSPEYFPKDAVAAGHDLMTQFVADVRSMLDRNQKDGPRKLLSVRVPRSPEACLEIGLDPLEWDQKKLIDMINVSSYFISTPEIDVESFLERADSSRVYSELHFITNTNRKQPTGFDNNISQKMTSTQYETLAHEFWSRGVDGLSFFNFAYCRDHHFDEPRRPEFPGAEPPFDVLKSIADPDHLKGRPRHYFLNENFGSLPLDLPADGSASVEMTMHLETDYSDGILRIETQQECWGRRTEVALNNQVLTPMLYTGELFSPLTLEGLPDPRCVRHFRIDPSHLRNGANVVEIRRPAENPKHKLTLRRLEAGLYPYVLNSCITGD